MMFQIIIMPRFLPGIVMLLRLRTPGQSTAARLWKLRGSRH